MTMIVGDGEGSWCNRYDGTIVGAEAFLVNDHVQKGKPPTNQQVIYKRHCLTGKTTITRLVSTLFYGYTSRMPRMGDEQRTVRPS